MKTYASKQIQAVRQVWALMIGLVLLFHADWAVGEHTSSGGFISDRSDVRINDHLSFEFGSSGYVDRPELPGFDLHGDVTMVTAMGRFELLESRLVFIDRDGDDLPFEVFGTALVPVDSFPMVGDILSASGFTDDSTRAPRASLGLVSRATLKGLETDPQRLPLPELPDPEKPDELANPAYLFFHFATEVGIDPGRNTLLGLDAGQEDESVSLNSGTDVGSTMIFDPSDPYFYVSSNGGAFDMDALNQSNENARDAFNAADDADDQASSNAGHTGNDTSDDANSDGRSRIELGSFGFSWHGGIPFIPENTWGLPEDIARTNGHFYLQGEIPLVHGLSIDGDLVTYAGEDGWQVGANGELLFGKGFGPIDLSLTLGDATYGHVIDGEGLLAYFSAVKSTDYSWLPEDFPVVPNQVERVAGVLDTANLDKTYIQASSQYSIDLSGFRSRTGLNVADLELSEGTLYVSSEGVQVTGMTATRIHQDIESGTTTVDGWLPFSDPLGGYIEMSGTMSIGGHSIGGSARARLDAKGLVVGGTFDTPLSSIEMAGEITSDGPTLTGRASINLPVAQFSGGIDDARNGVAAAHAELEKINVEINQMRARIEGERKAATAALSGARTKVEKAESTVSEINKQIRYLDRKIDKLKDEIKKLKKKKKKAKWHEKAWREAKYQAGKAWRKPVIASYEIAKVSLIAARGAALAALEVAEQALHRAEKAVDTLPVDADPRMVALFSSREASVAAVNAADASLSTAQSALDGVGKIDAEVKITITRGGANGEVSIHAGKLEVVDGTVILGLHPKVRVTIAPLGEACVNF